MQTISTTIALAGYGVVCTVMIALLAGTMSAAEEENISAYPAILGVLFAISYITFIVVQLIN